MSTTPAAHEAEVRRYAEDCVRQLLPSAMLGWEGSTLFVSRGSGGLWWPLAAMVGDARRHPDWRSMVEAQSKNLALQLLYSRDAPVEPASRDTMQIRLLPRSAVPEWAGDEVFPGIVALYGWPDALGGFVPVSEFPSHPLDQRGMRQMTSLQTIATRPFCVPDIVRWYHPSVPVFAYASNPYAAALLLVPVVWTDYLLPLLGSPQTLLAAAPSLGQLLLAVGDDPATRRELLRVAAKEPHTFPRQLYRFSEGAWSTLGG